MYDLYAKQIAHHLSLHNVRRVCLCPGSRSAPLACAIAEEKGLEKMVHFDERGAGFHAYGYAKSSKTPVAVVVTSGSAVANLFPAVMDAFLEEIPLIILTADRPPELLDCGANQTCDQVKIFGNYVRWYASIPTPDRAIPEGFIGSTIAYAVAKATGSQGGPVHLNCSFREPFFMDDSFKPTPPVVYESAQCYLDSKTIEMWAQKCASVKNGVIITGAMSIKHAVNPLCELAKRLDWPILTDILSPLRSQGIKNHVIPYSDLLLAHMPKPEGILHFGDRLVSKSLTKWIESSSPVFYAMINRSDHRHNPSHRLTHKITMDPIDFCNAMYPLIDRKTSWGNAWKNLGLIIDNMIDTLIPPACEPALFRFLHHHIPEHFSLFLGNSLPIRDADRFFFPKTFQGTIFGKRGSSGIEGNIATAIGLAEGAKTPLMAIMGDITALHDVNSLPQLHKSSVPVIIVIINNQGGGIFSFLPVSEKKEIFEEYFATAHSLNFQHAAQMFSIPYFLMTNPQDMLSILKKPISCIIELQTNRKENYLLHKEIASNIEQIIKQNT